MRAKLESRSRTSDQLARQQSQEVEDIELSQQKDRKVRSSAGSKTEVLKVLLCEQLYVQSQ